MYIHPYNYIHTSGGIEFNLVIVSQHRVTSMTMYMYIYMQSRG